MSFRRGDVVLVNYPFSSGSGGKVRPALVVQCDRNNARLKSTIVVQITSRTRHADHEPTQLLIQLHSDSAQGSGLLTDSAVSCENIFTVHSDLIIRIIGHLAEPAMEEIDTCLQESLGLT